MDSQNMNEMQVNFIAPFTTGAIVDPLKLAKKSYKPMQNAFKKVLTQKLEIPFEAIKPLSDEPTNTIFSKKYEKNFSVYPTALLEAKLAEQEIENLNYMNYFLGKSVVTKYVSRSYKDIPQFEIEIKEITIRIYHYGFGNLTIKTIIKFPSNFSLDKESLCSEELKNQLKKSYINIRDFINDCAKTNDSRVKYGCPVIFQFLPLIKEIHKVMNIEKKLSLQRFTKNFHDQVEDLSDKMIIKKKGFLWVHRLFYLPVPSNDERTQIRYARIARQVLGSDILGTKVKYLSNEKCKIAYVSTHNSFALVHKMIPLSQNLVSQNKDDKDKYIDQNPTTRSLNRVIQTAGALDAATIDLVFSLDLFMDLYDHTEATNKRKGADDIIEDSVQRISHIRTMIYQYHFSLPLVGKRVFDAIEKEWNLDKRYNYINWKFQTLMELHDRKTDKNLNRTTLNFSIITAIGVMLSLFMIAQNGDNLPRVTFDLSGSLVILFLVPLTLFLLIKAKKPLVKFWNYQIRAVKSLYGRSYLLDPNIQLKKSGFSRILRRSPLEYSLVLSIIFFVFIIPLFFLVILLADWIFDYDFAKAIMDNKLPHHSRRLK